ncbi:MAG: branched-chain amino acid ABC transporter permease [Alphaproteobacteria bacterium]|nr:branched-chain amino acid ABC transporter permease [Alphaproteobacteria bacterium]
MIEFFIAYRPVFDIALLHAGLAYSQYIVLRAGAFSVAVPGLAAIGAYAAAILAMRHGLHPLAAVLTGSLLGMAVSLVLALPLARLRGVYQAIASLAFVQIVLSLNLFAQDLTGGAMGLTGIPKLVHTTELAIALVVVLYVMFAIDATRAGRAFDAIRQDEAVAASLGISVTGYQMLAFAVSGAIAGLFGALEAFHGYALEPNQFGFGLLITVLTYVVFGGRRTVLGPLVGTAILVALPELARPLQDNRLLVYGLLMMAVIAFMPQGVYDTLKAAWHRRRMARGASP